MKAHAAAAAVAAAVSLGGGNVARADMSIIDNNKKLTLDCAKNPRIELIGNHITATLTGTCAKVQIMGNHATVSGSTTTIAVTGNHNVANLDAVDDISVAGKNNTVSWKKGASKNAPTVANPGKDNKVTQAN
ncbi:MAG: DUF3060 domain-containing protein [Deltaproteobacteria bacterium]|nr:DUF3060 domain-containing protein [Deltaproteobacteria bacterium]